MPRQTEAVLGAGKDVNNMVEEVERDQHALGSLLDFGSPHVVLLHDKVH